jgi:hypothetical protein
LWRERLDGDLCGDGYGDRFRLDGDRLDEVPGAGELFRFHRWDRRSRPEELRERTERQGLGWGDWSRWRGRYVLGAQR